MKKSVLVTIYKYLGVEELIFKVSLFNKFSRLLISEQPRDYLEERILKISKDQFLRLRICEFALHLVNSFEITTRLLREKEDETYIYRMLG